MNKKNTFSGRCPKRADIPEIGNCAKRSRETDDCLLINRIRRNKCTIDIDTRIAKAYDHDLFVPVKAAVAVGKNPKVLLMMMTAAAAAVAAATALKSALCIRTTLNDYQIFVVFGS